MDPQSPFSLILMRLRWLHHRVTSIGTIAEVIPRVASKGRDYAVLMRLHRPIGIWLLLWPVLWALWISSEGQPNEQVFVIFLFGVLLTRSAGCIINDYADRKIDIHVRRTRDRPIAAGIVDPSEALALFVAIGLIAVGLVLTLNRLSQWMAVAGAGLIVTYPFMKRFFPLPQFYLGAAFGWAVPMAYAAQTGTVPRLAWLIFLAGVLWTMAYDTMYAMVDREDDLRIGVRSSAILFGDADRFIIGIMQLMSIFALWLLGREAKLGPWYGLGLVAAAIFALYQQYLIREREPAKCLQAFNNNNYFGMAVFVGLALDYLFK